MLAPFRRLMRRDEQGIGMVEMLVVASVLTVLLLSVSGMILTARTYKQRSERLGESLQVMRFAATRFSEDMRYYTDGTLQCTGTDTVAFLKAGQPVLEYHLEQKMGVYYEVDGEVKERQTLVVLHRRRDANGDGVIDPGTETEILIDNLWGIVVDLAGSYLDCVGSGQAMIWLTVLDPTRQTPDPDEASDEAKLTISVQAAIRK